MNATENLLTQQLQQSRDSEISFKQYHDSVATLIEITKEEHKLIHYQKETEVQKQ